MIEHTLLRIRRIRISDPKHSLPISPVLHLLCFKNLGHLARVTTVNLLIAIEESGIEHLTLKGSIAVMHGTANWQVAKKHELYVMRGTAVCAPSP